MLNTLAKCLIIVFFMTTWVCADGAYLEVDSGPPLSVSEREKCLSDWKAMEETLKKNPDDFKRWSAYMSCASSLGRLSDGADFSSVLAGHFPKSYLVAYYAGYFAMSLGRYAQGIPFLLQAHALLPDEHLPVRDLCGAYTLSQRYETSISYCEKAAGWNPESPQFHQALAMAYYSKEDGSALEKTARQGLDLFPKDIPLKLFLSKGLLLEKRPQEAEKVAQEALAEDPQNSDAVYNLKEIEEHKNDGVSLSYQEKGSSITHKVPL